MVGHSVTKSDHGIDFAFRLDVIRSTAFHSWENLRCNLPSCNIITNDFWTNARHWLAREVAFWTRFGKRSILQARMKSYRARALTSRCLSTRLPLHGSTRLMPP